MSRLLRARNGNEMLKTPKIEDSKSKMSPKADLVKLKLQNTAKFDVKLLQSSKYKHNDVVTQMLPEDFTIDFYHKDGLNNVLLFDCDPKKLKMKIPPKSFTPRDVMWHVGKNRSVKYIDVRTQTEYTTSLEGFVDHYEDPFKDESYNVISLEVSGTGLMDLVEAPALIRQIDLASAWPDERKQREVNFDVSENSDEPTLFDYENKYPRVEHFCLMSESASYTGFHIDFHGSSVWYHVVNGKKVFFLIEPTEENIRKYEEYLKRRTDFSFFGDIVEKCTRITVNAGETLMLPSGWIHAVYTPEDALVFGGNFIHPLSLKMQLRIVRHENELELKKDVKYPQADEVFFHYMDDVVRRVTGRRHIRPSSRNRQKEGLQYVGEKFVEMKRHRLNPDVRDFKEMRNDTWRLASNRAIPEAWRDVEETDEYKYTTRILAELNGIDTDPDEFFIKDHPLIFFHPKEFNLESQLKGTNPCGDPLPLRFNEDDAQMAIDDALLRQCLHPSEIVGWEALIETLLLKETVNLPEGLTRPNSLVHSFYCLLTRRRRIESRKDSTRATKYIVPRRECILVHEWNGQSNNGLLRPKQEPRSTPDFMGITATPLRGVKRERVESQSASPAPPPSRRTRVDQEKIEPTVAQSLLDSSFSSLKCIMGAAAAAVQSVLAAAAAAGIQLDPSTQADLATTQALSASIIAASIPTPTMTSSPTATAISTIGSQIESEHLRDEEDVVDEGDTESSISSTPAAATPIPRRIRSQSKGRPSGLTGRPYSEQECEVVVRQCREWLLGYDKRQAKVAEANATRVYASAKTEARGRARASAPKPREPCFGSVENLGNIRKELPDRTERSIAHQITRMKSENPLMTILEQFYNGTLTRGD